MFLLNLSYSLFRWSNNFVQKYRLSYFRPWLKVVDYSSSEELVYSELCIFRKKDFRYVETYFSLSRWYIELGIKGFLGFTKKRVYGFNFDNNEEAIAVNIEILKQVCPDDDYWKKLYSTSKYIKKEKEDAKK